MHVRLQVYRRAFQFAVAVGGACCIPAAAIGSYSGMVLPQSGGGSVVIYDSTAGLPQQMGGPGGWDQGLYSGGINASQGNTSAGAGISLRPGTDLPPNDPHNVAQLMIGGSVTAATSQGSFANAYADIEFSPAVPVWYDLFGNASASGAVGTVEFTLTDMSTGATFFTATPSTPAGWERTGTMQGGRNYTASVRIEHGGAGESASASCQINFRGAIPGDANLDWKVDFSDLTTLARNYGTTNATWANGDFDNDGRVDFPDLVILARHYGQSLAGADVRPAIVPEPASFVLPGLATVGLMIRRMAHRCASFQSFEPGLLPNWGAP